MLGLIEHREREVLHGNPTPPALIREQFILSGPVPAGALPGLEQRAWAEIGPVHDTCSFQTSEEAMRGRHQHPRISVLGDSAQRNIAACTDRCYVLFDRCVGRPCGDTTSVIVESSHVAPDRSDEMPALECFVNKP